jgi:hypothetical protein
MQHRIIGGMESLEEESSISNHKQHYDDDDDIRSSRSNLKTRILWNRKLRSCLFFGLLVWLLGWFGITVLSKQWDVALFNVRLEDLGPDGCNIQPNFAIMDYLPLRILNFWKLTWCRTREFSRLYDNHTLEIFGCNQGESWYVLDPDFEEEAASRGKRFRGEFMERLITEHRESTIARNALANQKIMYRPGHPVSINSSEIVVTYCKMPGSSIVEENYHIQNLLSPKLMDQANLRRSWLASSHSEEDIPFSPSHQRPLNVLILLYDSLSWPHFRRALPQTVQTLESLSKRIQFFQFLRYNVLGVNSVPNLNPMFW